MATEADRQKVLALYPKSKTWRDKVNAMPEDQITAIIMRLKSQKQPSRRTP